MIFKFGIAKNDSWSYTYGKSVSTRRVNIVADEEYLDLVHSFIEEPNHHESPNDNSEKNEEVAEKLSAGREKETIMQAVYAKFVQNIPCPAKNISFYLANSQPRTPVGIQEAVLLSDGSTVKAEHLSGYSPFGDGYNEFAVVVLTGDTPEDRQAVVISDNVNAYLTTDTGSVFEVINE